MLAVEKYATETLVRLVQMMLGFADEQPWFDFKRNHLAPERLGLYLSGMSNTACACRRPYGYLVFGIDDTTHEVVGTTFDPLKEEGEKKGEPLVWWLQKGLKPTYLFPEREIRVTLKGAPDDLSGLEPAQRKLLGLDAGSHVPVNVPVNDIANTANGRVNGRVNLGRAAPLYEAICQHPGLRQGKLCEITGLSDRTIRRYLAEDLANLVEFRGAPKTGGYYAITPTPKI